DGAAIPVALVRKWTKQRLLCQFDPMEPSDEAPLQVALLALPETTPASIYGLHEILSSVGVAWAEITGLAPRTRRVEARIVARGDSSSSALGPGPRVVPHADLEAVAAADIVVVSDLGLSRDF